MSVQKKKAKVKKEYERHEQSENSFKKDPALLHYTKKVFIKKAKPRLVWKKNKSVRK